MDQITKHRVDQAAEELIASIDPSKVCKLATSFHPAKSPCRIFSDWKKGGFNVCFPVIFNQDAESVEGEKWMVRIPLLPRLAFPEEKMRGEIATMKYIAEKTTIPIPRLHGYSIHGDDNVLGLPFMLMEYTEGKTLAGVVLPDLEKSTREHLYTQLADVYIQLYHQQFDRIGALTLDENDENWIFANNRPLSVDINDQEVGGFDFCSRFLPPQQTFTSAIDYVYLIFRLIYNDYSRCPDSIMGEEDAQHYRYSIWAGQGVVMNWVKPKYNHGPFILMHGDLRPPNIVVDDNFNITSILDWEWSHTLPVQLFAVPPYWLTNLQVVQIAEPLLAFPFMIAARDFINSVCEHVHTSYNPHRQLRSELPVVKVWRQQAYEDQAIAHGLLKPHSFGNVYCHALDSRYYDWDRNQRVEAFFKLTIWQPELDILKQKVVELACFEKKRQELGVQQRVTFSSPTLTPEQEAKLGLKDPGEKAEKVFGDGDETEGDLFARVESEVRRKGELKAELERPHTRWPLIAIGAICLVYLVSRDRRN
ncbi:uncharacterized protein BDCG_09259 [Blastomyces dermatitidis ER-3]|uniref:Aminoglycoside phosphotransferase domain-containing protein n=2 Tax=Ajellomyces dermatitidis TaxID=5039 RepID=F2TTN6_AJEDA|nr:uncharacterized protein BDCG_09259 [Blastomyces dermatitidis ER-3]EEQ85990.1 hypothetical protein BDCG_09259 [Blastomyces dermatitidis ER-3]EGE86599.1 hypothetical protein BDDG_09545 [Blastomyces dermatitidis ATCC 18188]EQL28892.1 hypothetical protein BDFG_08413 [Blastomyces dermatitidis ATCC 26199]